MAVVTIKQKDISIGFMAHGVVNESEATLISIGVGNNTLSIAPFTYWLRGTEYKYLGQTNISLSLTDVVYGVVYVDTDSSTFKVVYDATLEPHDYNDKLEIGRFATNGSIVTKVGDSYIDLDDFILNTYKRSKLFEDVKYRGSAGLITKNDVNPLHLDIAEGFINDPSRNTEFISGEIGLGAISFYNVAGVYTLQPLVTPYVVNISQYDDGTNLVALGSNKYTTHTISRSAGTGSIYVVIGTEQYTNLSSAQEAPIQLGTFIGIGLEVSPIAQVIVQEGVGIVSILSLRNNVNNILSATTTTMQTTYNRSSVPQIVLTESKHLEIRNNVGDTNNIVSEYTSNDGSAKYLQITKDGLLHSAGYKDLTSTFNASKTTQSASPTWEQWLGGIYSYSFSPSVLNEMIPAPFHVGHDYLLGSKMHFHVHFASSSTNVGTVRWGIELTFARGHNQEAYIPTQTIYLEQVMDGTLNKHYIVEDLSGLFDGGIIEPDTLIECRVFRDATHVNDTYPDKVWGKTVDLHYLANRETTPLKVPPFIN